MPITAHYTSGPYGGKGRLNAGAIALLSGRPIIEVAQWQGQLPDSALAAARARRDAAAVVIGSGETRDVLAYLAIHHKATLVVDGKVWVLAGIEAVRD